MTATIIGLARDSSHRFSKAPCQRITLLAGLGVEGDAHAGRTVQHLSRIKTAPDSPNLRQVHLIHAELFDELADKGFAVEAGELGENVTTRGIDLLALPSGIRLRLGADALIEITGLRNPCRQIDGLAKGLMAAVLDKDDAGNLIRKCGVMAVVITGGMISVGDEVSVASVPKHFQPLEPV